MRWVLLFAAWTLLVWTGRLRNVLGDDSLDGAGVAWRLLLAGAFVAFGVTVLALGLSARRAGGSSPSPTSVRLVQTFAAFTVIVWVVRGGGILLDDHDTGFKVVHTVLALGSIALALLATRAVTARRHESERRRVLAADR